MKSRAGLFVLRQRGDIGAADNGDSAPVGVEKKNKEVVHSDSSMLDFINVNTMGKKTRLLIMKLTEDDEG